MFGSRKNPGLGRTAATGMVFDPELRRATLQAIPPVARLGYVLAKRMATRQLGDAGDAFTHLAEQLGLTEPEPPPQRKLLPAVGGVAVVAIAVLVATDQGRRQRLQRLFVH